MVRGRIGVQSVTYQRNGVAGVDFYHLFFTHGGRRFVGWVYPDYGDDPAADPCRGYYGVVCLDDPAERWRGDDFVVDLRRAVAEAGDRAFRRPEKGTES